MPEPSLTSLSEFRELVVTTDAFGPERKAVKYRFLAPDEVRPDAKFPLVLFLHGAGERGNDNRKQLLYLPDTLSQIPNRKRYPCFAVAPQCPQNMKWVDVPWDEEASPPQPAASGPMKMVLAILDEVLHTWPIDPARIYLTGLSMGGFGAWDLAMRRPKQFAAVAPLCGGGDELQAALLKDVPIWAVHGEMDAAVPVNRSRRMIKAIENAGGKPKYTELPGVGHNCWSKAYAPDFGLLDWLFEQRRAGA
jgi:predicted peptidase